MIMIMIISIHQSGLFTSSYHVRKNWQWQPYYAINRGHAWSTNNDMYVSADAGSRLQSGEDRVAVSEVTLQIQCYK